MIKKLTVLLLLCCSMHLFAQKKENPDAPSSKLDTAKPDDRTIKAESSVVTNGEVAINGVRVGYTATAGTLPVWDSENKVAATLFYTY